MTTDAVASADASPTNTGSIGGGAVIFSVHEEMNPTKRSTMEDCLVALQPGEWGSDEYALAGVYDGHGGKSGKVFFGFRIFNCHFSLCHHQSLQPLKLHMEYYLPCKVK